MPMRRPNLLDAFRRAHDVPVPPTGGPGTTPARAEAPKPPPTAGNSAPRERVRSPETPAPVRPASAPVRAAPEPAAPPRIAPPAAAPAAPPRERLVLLALALAVATLAVVMLWRRTGSGGADAANVQAATPTTAPTPAPTPTAPPTAPATAAPEVARAPHDAALYDARNRYTVRLIQYPNDKQGLALATEAYRWLVKFGYPVGSPILLANGRGIVLCASAKPTKEELVPLRDSVRRLRYPESSKTMPFSDAYIDEIDDVLAR